MKIGNRGRLSIICLTLLMLLGSGCASNPVRQFYSPNLSAALGAKFAFAPLASAPQIFRSGDITSDGKLLQQNQFILVGWSAFNSSADVTPKMIQECAAYTQADLVLVSAKRAGDKSGVAVVPVFNPGTTLSTTISGTSATRVTSPSGPLGSLNTVYAGSVTTSSPGSFSPVVVPYTVSTSDWEILFWKRLKNADRIMREEAIRKREIDEMNARGEKMVAEYKELKAKAAPQEADALLQRITDLQKAVQKYIDESREYLSSLATDTVR